MVRAGLVDDALPNEPCAVPWPPVKTTHAANAELAMTSAATRTTAICVRRLHDLNLRSMRAPFARAPPPVRGALRRGWPQSIKTETQVGKHPSPRSFHFGSGSGKKPRLLRGHSGTLAQPSVLSPGLWRRMVTCRI